MSIIWDNISFTDYIDVDKSEINNLPAGMGVSTMCASCKLNTLVNIVNIEKYFQLNSDDILTVKMNKERLRTIILTKKKPKRQRKNENKLIHKDTTKNYFYNQITVVMRIDSGPCQDLNDAPKINIKLFKNGSIQMTGCDSIDHTKYSIEKLFEILNKPRYLLNLFEKNISTIKFLKTENDKIITIDDIIQCNVHLINCNFNIGFKINRDKLFDIISNKNSESILEIKKNNNVYINSDLPQKYIDSTYDPIRHACVNIKLNHPIKIITIFVFESGSIIILGKSCKQIRDAYNFINVFLLTNYFNIYLKSD